MSNMQFAKRKMELLMELFSPFPNFVKGKERGEVTTPLLNPPHVVKSCWGSCTLGRTLRRLQVTAQTRAVTVLAPPPLQS